ncbi:hypothetical protein DDR33_09940 [Pararcticibacter amylolyticus]|uniref:NlpC/P60 domain-containing protein n=2 Tax=Pararcticibacter amylolyticus TaxID=2173175 RepID=A0A2U2PH84_9SPHI|nr:hypothetical protein DDR33_09940 [Pararcticibacter amylolyticus]
MVRLLVSNTRVIKVNNEDMKAVYLVLLFFVVNLPVRAAGTGDSLEFKKANELIESTRKKFAPDKRTALFAAEFTVTSPLAVHVETTEPDAVLHLKRLFTDAGLSILIKEHILPDSDLHGLIYGLANLSVCNNRVRPEQSAELVTQVLLGTPVIILKKERGYYLVRTPDQYLSWIEDNAVAAMDKFAFDSWKQENKVVFTADYGHAFEEPSFDATRVSDLVAGNILVLKGKAGKFYRVIYPDGRTGYVPVKQCRPYSKWAGRKDPDPSQIINTAKMMTGVPYLWGGTSVKGVDCSGFTKTSYFLNGIILARDASQQALYGEKIDIYENDSLSVTKCLKNLLPGDLLFFGTRRADRSDRVTHTAIYIGKGEFIQSSGMVRISSLVRSSPLYDTYHSPGLLSARRILTAIGTEGITRVREHSLYQNISN